MQRARLGSIRDRAGPPSRENLVVTTRILSDDHLAILMVEEANPGVVCRIVHFEGGAPR